MRLTGGVPTGVIILTQRLLDSWELWGVAGERGGVQRFPVAVYDHADDHGDQDDVDEDACLCHHAHSPAGDSIADLTIAAESSAAESWDIFGLRFQIF